MSLQTTSEAARHCLCPYKLTHDSLCAGDNCMAWTWSQEPWLTTLVRVKGEEKPPEATFREQLGEGDWQPIDGAPYAFSTGGWGMDWRRDRGAKRLGRCGRLAAEEGKK